MAFEASSIRLEMGMPISILFDHLFIPHGLVAFLRQASHTTVLQKLLHNIT